MNPNNALFDAMVWNDLQGTIQFDAGWDAQGIRTSVTRAADDECAVYDIFIPHLNFNTAPIPGTEWRVNLYRSGLDECGF